jgi:hypothetical protein
MLMRLDHRDEAASCFVESVKQKPYNWSCWSQMTQLVNSTDMVRFPLQHELMLVYRFERTYPTFSYAYVCGYYRHAGLAYRYRLDVEYDQGIGRYLPW